MDTLYGDIPTEEVVENIDDLIGQVFKLLPYRENGREDLDYCFTTLLFRLEGFSKIVVSPEIVTIMSLLEAAKDEEDFHLYRKAILDSCSILKKLKEQYDGAA